MAQGAGRLTVQSFVVYYGYGPMDGIVGYDVAVLEPRGWKAPDVARVRAQGTRTLAYLSMLEAMDWEAPSLALRPEDYLRVDGRPWRRPEFGTTVVDPRSPRWQAHLARRVQVLYEAGWDGVFLDGLGDVEDPIVASETGWLLPAVVGLVRLVRERMGMRPVVMNNGVWLVLPWVAPYIDGVCWEIGRTPDRADETHVALALDQMAQQAVQRGMARFLLTSVPPAAPKAAEELRKFHKFADTQGFVAYAAPGEYAAAVRTRSGSVRGKA